ncbi:MAG: ACT domain-containing protein [Clostridia bacterium]|nr:ACT domain-containing protein [Oscillospiraceae bacterium]MBQ6796501.1 ACT domain-containing protein [Clostridia bacterium]
MRAVLTVIGKDMVGILAGVSNICAETGVNIVEVTQSILQDMFAMIMLVDISASNVPFDELSSRLSKYGEENALSVRIMHEDIFNSMHRI